jgi:hypothetical protein
MDKRIATLLEPPAEEQLFTMTKECRLTVTLEAEVVAKDLDQAFDIARHDLTNWTIKRVAGTDWPDVDKIIAKISANCRVIERMRADGEIATWRGIAIMFGVMWATENVVRILRMVLS